MEIIHIAQTKKINRKKANFDLCIILEISR